MDETWMRWEPAISLPLKLYVMNILDSINGFRIEMCDANDEGKKIVVIFEHSVHAYRSTDESFMQSTLNTINQRYGTDFYAKWTFFKVSDSEYLQWLSRESYGISESESLSHFSFLAVDSIVDVIAAYEPKVVIM